MKTDFTKGDWYLSTTDGQGQKLPLAIWCNAKIAEKTNPELGKSSNVIARIELNPADAPLMANAPKLFHALNEALENKKGWKSKARKAIKAATVKF